LREPALRWISHLGETRTERPDSNSATPAAAPSSARAARLRSPALAVVVTSRLCTSALMCLWCLSNGVLWCQPPGQAAQHQHPGAAGIPPGSCIYHPTRRTRTTAPADPRDGQLKARRGTTRTTATADPPTDQSRRGGTTRATLPAGSQGRPAQGSTAPPGRWDDRASASWDDGTTGRPRPQAHQLEAPPSRQPHQGGTNSSRHHGTARTTRTTAPTGSQGDQLKAPRDDGTTARWHHQDDQGGTTASPRTTVPAGPQDDQLEATTALLTAASVVNAPRWRRSGRRESNSRVQLGKRRGYGHGYLFGWYTRH